MGTSLGMGFAVTEMERQWFSSPDFDFRLFAIGCYRARDSETPCFGECLVRRLKLSTGSTYEPDHGVKNSLYCFFT